MSADKKQDGLEFASFNLAEESAGEWEGVSAEGYRPVAEVIKLDSFEIDFEPDEDAPQSSRSRRSASSRNPLFVEEKSQGAEEPGELSGHTLDRNAPAVKTSSASAARPLAVPAGMAGSAVAPKVSSRGLIAPAGDLFLGIDSGDDLPGLSVAKTKKSAGNGGSGGSAEVGERVFPPVAGSTDFGGLLEDLAETRAADGTWDEEDILGALPPLTSKAAIRGHLPAQELSAGGGENEEFESDGTRQTSSNPKSRLQTADQERVPLKLRGRLTGQEKVERRKRVADGDPEEILGSLGRSSANRKTEEDLTSLLDEFSAPEAWGELGVSAGRAGDADTASEPEFDGLGLGGGKKNRESANPSDALDLEDEFSGVDFSSLPGKSSRGNELEVGIDTLLAQADELTGVGGRKKKRRAGSEPREEQLSGFDGNGAEGLTGLGDDLSGWGEDNLGGSGEDLHLDGMELDDDSDELQPLFDYDNDEGEPGGRHLPPEGHAFVRAMERLRQRTPGFRELTRATREWLRLLCSLPATIREERSLIGGAFAWLSDLRSFTGLERSLFLPWRWRRTSLTGDSFSGGGEVAFGTGLPDLHENDDGLDIPAGSIFALGGELGEGGVDDSGWGVEGGANPAAASVEDWASAAEEGVDLSGANPPAADSDMPPDDILPEEDLSFSTADMLMQDSELGLGGLEDEFDLSSDDAEAQTPEDIPVGEESGWGGLGRALGRLARKWVLLCYHSLDHHIGFQNNWWKIVDFLALVILTMAGAAFLSYWLWYQK